MDEPVPLRVALTVEQLWQPVPGGSGTYIRELAHEYAALPELSVIGLVARHGECTRAPEGLELPLRRSRLPRAALYETWQRFRRPQIGREVADLVHATTWAVPGRRVPLVVTVHDLAFLEDPGHFTPRGVRFFRRGLEIARTEAAAVVVPSKATHDDCVTAGLRPDRLHIVPHGVRPPTTSPEQVTDFRMRYSLTRPYVLWAGTREPRKNLPTLVEAFSRVLDAGADLDLVLAGPEGWGPEQDRLPSPQEGRVRLLGRLSPTDLQAAYAGALVFCYPSLREGYGMPVTEAMAHGTPVVTSRGTATEEAAGGAALLVDPRDEVELAASLLEACTDTCQAPLRAASLERAAALSWRSAARATAEVYRAAVGR